MDKGSSTRKKLAKGWVIMKSSKLVKTAAELPYLPPEIISEFLILLPVKILLKLCCVSKQWHALITVDPIFRASYRARSERNPRILLKHRYTGIDHFSSLDKDGKLDPVGRFETVEESLCVVPCLDLVCLYDTINMYIWNPSTRDIIHLPDYLCRPKISQPQLYVQEVAFGYLASTSEYKLLHIRKHYFNIDQSYCEILTLGSDQQWKATNEIPRGGYHFGVASFGGAAYLLRFDGDLVRFDLEREEWAVIEGPRSEDLGVGPCAISKVMELGGSLCLADCDMHRGTAMWFLEDYDDKGMWVCKYNIDASPLSSAGAGENKLVVPLVIEKDERILLHIQFTNKLYCYDPRNKSFEAICFNCGPSRISPSVYIESFTSLKF